MLNKHITVLTSAIAAAVALFAAATAAFAETSTSPGTSTAVSSASAASPAGPVGAIDLGALGVVDPTAAGLAAYMGTDPAGLAAELSAGNTLAALAANQGKSGDDVAEFLRAEVMGVVQGATDTGLIGPDAADVLESQVFNGFDVLIYGPPAPQPVQLSSADAPSDPTLAPNYTTETPGG